MSGIAEKFSGIQRRVSNKFKTIFNVMNSEGEKVVVEEEKQPLNGGIQRRVSNKFKTIFNVMNSKGEKVVVEEEKQPLTGGSPRKKQKTSASSSSSPLSLDDKAVVERFRSFLRIRTVSGEGPLTGAYQEAVTFLQDLFDKLQLKTEVVEFVKNKPVLIVTWTGSQPDLPCILLNSHYDVVPAMPEKWSVDPWAAVMDEKSEKIYGRGSQDMKVVCMEYFEAILLLKQQIGYTPTRTIVLTYMPDEEIGGKDGMEKFIQAGWIDKLNIGVALDEGLANEGKTATAADSAVYTLFYGERTPWWVKVVAKGPTGHGSRFVENTAMMKLTECVNKFLDFRRAEEAKLKNSNSNNSEKATTHTGPHSGCKHAMALKLGDVSTINLTVLQGGVSTDGGKTFAYNVIPTEVMAGFDIRLTPSVDLQEFENKVKEWTKADGMTYEFLTSKQMKHHITSLDPTENPWFGVLQATAASMQFRLEPEIFPAATDGRYLRAIGVPVFGFSPMSRTPCLLHDHDEFISRDVYLQGVKVYVQLIQNLAEHQKSD